MKRHKTNKTILGVDEAFRNLLDGIFGPEVMEEYRKLRPAGYVELMNAFESRKRGCAPKKITPMNIALPFSFIDFFHKMKKSDVSFELGNADFKNGRLP